MSPHVFTDEAYPDGMEWRCEACGHVVKEDAQWCPQHPGAPAIRVARRWRWGELPAQVRDVEVEQR